MFLITNIHEIDANILATEYIDLKEDRKHEKDRKFDKYVIIRFTKLLHLRSFYAASLINLLKIVWKF